MTETLLHPVFGELTLNAEQNCWQGKVFLDLVNQIVLLDFDGDNENGPTEEQIRSCTAFMRASADLQPGLEKALYQYYSYTRELLLQTMPEETFYFEHDMPPVSRAEEVGKLMTAKCLLVLPQDASADGNIILHWECTWDIEHGVSAFFRDGSLIEVDI